MTKDEAAALIREKTPALLEEYRAVAGALKKMTGAEDEAAGEDLTLPEADADELEELYEAVGEFAQMYDLDSIDMLVGQMEKGFRMPESERERFGKLKKAVRESDWDVLREITGG